MKSVEKNKTEVLITESEPVIKRIDLVNQGRDGVKVTYSTMETRNSVASVVETKREQKRPCQRELRNLFQQLRQHLLASAGYYWSNVNVLEMLGANVDVTYCLVTHGQDQFQLGGKMKVLNGGYTIAVNGPCIKNEDYDDYGDLNEILHKIKNETTLFMKGIKGADSRLVVIDYMITKREMADAESVFEKMSKEEQEAMMREAFEGSGMVVSEENGEMVLSVAEEVEEEIEKVESVVTIETHEDLGLDSPSETSQENVDDFEIPVMQSTKKGKK